MTTATTIRNSSAPDGGAQAPGERRFAFTFGDGRWWVVPTAILTEIPIGAHLQPLPNAPLALAGAINVRGAIRLVFDPLRFGGEVPDTAGVGQRRILLLDRDEHCAGLLIVGEPLLSQVRPDPAPFDAGPFNPFVQQVLVASDGQRLFELDHRAWFRHQREAAMTASPTTS